MSNTLLSSSVFAPKNRSVIAQLVIGLASVFLVLFLKIWIPDIGRQSPFLLFTTAILLCGWFAGLVSSMTVSLVSAIIVSFIFVSPFGVLNESPVSSIEAGVFIVESFLLSIFIEFAKRVIETFLEEKQVANILMESNSVQGIILLDERNHIIDWNPAAERIFGYKKEEIIGKPFSRICDKKTWFSANNTPLYLHVVTKIVYSPANKIEYRIKIVRKVPESNPVITPESFPASLDIPMSPIPTPQIL